MQGIQSLFIYIQFNQYMFNIYIYIYIYTGESVCFPFIDCPFDSNLSSGYL